MAWRWGGVKGFGSGGVGGRGTGPRVVFLLFLTRTKTRKMAFFEGCPVGWGGVPTGAGLVDGGVDQGPWLQEKVGGGVGAGWWAWLAVPKRGLAVPQEGARARGGIQGLRFRKGRCVIFRKLEG